MNINIQRYKRINVLRTSQAPDKDCAINVLLCIKYTMKAINNESNFIKYPIRQC